MELSTDSIASSIATNDSTCESKGSSEKDDKLMIMKQDQSNPGSVKYLNNEEVTNDSIQYKYLQLQMEKLIDYLRNSQHNEDIVHQIEDIEQKLQYQKQLVHKTGKKTENTSKELQLQRKGAQNTS